MKILEKFKKKIKTESFKCLFSGLIELLLCCHGYTVYPTIEYTMREDGYFSQYSEEDQEKAYARIYSLIIIFNQVNKIFLGALIDWKGIWFARSIVHVEMIIGLTTIIIMISIGPAVEYLAYFGFPIYIGCSIGLVFTSIRLTDLDADNRGKWNSAIGSAVSLGQQLYLVYRQMNSSSRVWFWVMLMCFEPVPILRTFLCTPRSNIITNGVGWKTRHDRVEKKDSRAGEAQDAQDPDQNQNSELSKFLKSFFSLNMILMLLWYICCDIRLQTFTAEYQSWLRWATNDDYDKITFYTDAQIYLTLTGIPLALCNGILVDKTCKFVQEKFNYNREPAMALTCYIWMSFCCIFGLLASFILSFKSTGWQTFVLLMCYLGITMSLYSTRNLYILCMIDKSIFGKVMGFSNAFGLVSAFVAPALTGVVNDQFGGDFRPLEYILLGVNVLGLTFPIMNYFWTFYFNEEFKKKVRKVN